MNSDIKMIASIGVAFILLCMGGMYGSYIDTQAQRDCRQKLATSERSAADISAICK